LDLSLASSIFGTGTATQAMKPIAAPMVGGLVPRTLLTLIVLPAIDPL
jgi:Cu/Ag efflux pump CusA